MPAYYRTTLSDFQSDDPDRVVGVLAAKSAENGFVDLKQKQTKAWRRQIDALRESGIELCRQIPAASNWGLLLEYPIPRRQRRVDAVILANDVVLCLEFKTEDWEHRAETRQQVEDYALDLRDFHEQSRDRIIVPIAVTLRAGPPQPSTPICDTERARPVRLANSSTLSECLRAAVQAETRDGLAIDLLQWDASAYRPVPTIIEAAESLFSGHNVAEIAHSHAGPVNLSITSERIIAIIRDAQIQRQKVLCLVTGVPGAGKTLAGLNVVHNPSLRENGRPAGVFLSGNGPLVKVVSAAIARDFKRRESRSGAERIVSTFVQNVHEFVREGLGKPDRPPVENIVVFDEAQRAWNAVHNSKKTQTNRSEPEVLLSIMDRHPDWAVLIALVGGGQEINSGEAGLAEWGRSVRSSFPHWHIHASAKAIARDASVAGHRLFEDGHSEGLSITEVPALHLDINIRSYRVQKLDEWVNAVVDSDEAAAAALFPRLHGFPLVLTRDLATARKWLHAHTRGQRRCGLVASSGSIRLRAEGLELSSGFRQGNRDLYVNWFLNLPPNVRSSNQLEIAASEFECQGLELGWIGMCWGGDMIRRDGNAGWRIRHFSGTGWRESSDVIDWQYSLNTYRVLLTRAREGTIVWVPRGETSDPTRSPAEFDAVAAYLKRCGLPEI